MRDEIKNLADKVIARLYERLDSGEYHWEERMTIAGLVGDGEHEAVVDIGVKIRSPRLKCEHCGFAYPMTTWKSNVCTTCVKIDNLEHTYSYKDRFYHNEPDVGRIHE